MKARFAALLAVLAAGCSGPPPGSPATPPGATTPSGIHPRTVLIIRHAEKPGDGSAGLSPAGVRRSEALPALFVKSASRPDPFPTPDFILATRRSKNSDRPAMTVAPLEKSLKLDVDARHADDDYARLAAEIMTGAKYDGKTVLVCWHHGKIPELAAALGVKPAAAKWSDRVFDRVWVVTFGEKGEANSLADRPQSLMRGDANE